jgi:hypothetical protein
MGLFGDRRTAEFLVFQESGVPAGPCPTDQAAAARLTEVIATAPERNPDCTGPRGRSIAIGGNEAWLHHRLLSASGALQRSGRGVAPVLGGRMG